MNWLWLIMPVVIILLSVFVAMFRPMNFFILLMPVASPVRMSLKTLKTTLKASISYVGIAHTA